MLTAHLKVLWPSPERVSRFWGAKQPVRSGLEGSLGCHWRRRGRLRLTTAGQLLLTKETGEYLARPRCRRVAVRPQPGGPLGVGAYLLTLWPHLPDENHGAVQGASIEA